MLALVAVALAQPVARVPPGAAAVTVLACPRADGCEPEWRALVAHATPLGLPVMDFDAVAEAGPGGRDALLAFEALLARLRAGKADAATVSEALARLPTLPFTVRREDLFRLWLAEGQNRFPSVEADAALAAAASLSDGRVADLGALPDAVLARYLDLAAPVARVPLVVTADVPGRVSVDGVLIGETPVTVELRPGWHRVTVERSGRLTAWVGTVELRPGTTPTLRAGLAPDDGSAALEAAVLSAGRGAEAPAATVDALRAWARDNGLSWVRFVELRSAESPRDGLGPVATLPEERFPDPDPSRPDWELRAVYLDVAAGRLGPRGPGPAALAVAGDPDRFRLGLGVGYLRLAELADTDTVPAHDHVTAELIATLRALPTVAVEARVGVAHAAQPYFLAAGWRDENVFPVGLGARWGRAAGGPYLSGGALIVVPYALGGQLAAGWDLAPATNWRVAPEARFGMTDKGWVAGGSVVAMRVR